MPRPQNKADLLRLAKANFSKLQSTIDRYNPSGELREFKLDTMNRNVRDVMGHLHQWHLMMEDWYTIGMSGKKPEMPAAGYTWKNTGALNKMIWEACQAISLAEMQSKLIRSHQAMLELIEKHTDEELFEKKRYPWTGSTSLGAYLISATSTHYDWAIKLIRKALK